jgi:hypothetical protein
MTHPLPGTALPAEASAAWEFVPLLAVLLAAITVLLFITLDLRRLSIAATMTTTHRVVGVVFGLSVVCLTLVMASSLESPAPARAGDADSHVVSDPDEYFGQLQLPTLADR